MFNGPDGTPDFNNAHDRARALAEDLQGYMEDFERCSQTAEQLADSDVRHVFDVLATTMGAYAYVTHALADKRAIDALSTDTLLPPEE